MWVAEATRGNCLEKILCIPVRAHRTILNDLCQVWEAYITHKMKQKNIIIGTPGMAFRVKDASSDSFTVAKALELFYVVAKQFLDVERVLLFWVLQVAF